MTSVIAKAHIQVAIGGVETDIFPGTTFDATSDQIGILLPVGAIYPIGTVLPVPPSSSTSVSPLLIGQGTPSNTAGSDGQTYLDVNGHGIYVKLAGAWMLMGYLAASSSGSVLPIAISGAPEQATVGVMYSFIPSTVNGSGTKAFALTGTLPAGLSFSTSTGAITGTPTTLGTTSGLSIGVTDTSGSASLGPFSITIAAATVAAPTNSTIPTISGTAQVGQTLTASQGTWTGSPTSYAYHWNRSGSAIAGATSATYAPVSGDIGATLTCTVTATNAGGSAGATSAATAVVAGTSPPSGTSAPGGGSGNSADYTDPNNAYLAALAA